MDEIELFAHEAADVAIQAIKERLNRVTFSWTAAHKRALADITAAHTLADDLRELGYIQEIPQETLAGALEEALNSV
jgi:hypothetical protein